MTIAEMFRSFCDNIRIPSGDVSSISSKYGEITYSLNKKFRDTTSKIANTLQVGSYGRKTGIKGISDLDMLYIMPSVTWNTYKDDQSKLLRDTKEAIVSRYPKTTVKVDRLVVQVLYDTFTVEVQPVFEQEDGSFKYPDTYGGGSWKITKPRKEIEAVRKIDSEKNNNFRMLSRMVRAWKNRNGVVMGGLLIDTLVYKFLMNTDDYDAASYSSYGRLSRDFFEYLKDQPDQNFYFALGSNQQVKVKKKFQTKANQAYNACLRAIKAGETATAHSEWKKVYGRFFPAYVANVRVADEALRYEYTEEFIEDKYPVDIRYSLELECKVTQNGFRVDYLTNLLRRGFHLPPRKTLDFTIDTLDLPDPDMILWKVLNRGAEAERRNCIRGQIVSDKGWRTKQEKTTFKGEHLVECYAVKGGVVVARGRIDVPIERNAENDE
ncbi:SMODS domain-containing nucleotidyltransferase [Oleidesulfovibrio alaskensis]|uniref:SMODS domain-containing nucleotidyltransferase n=1 Tax=Oleidesulfovibrio alaskensis TaxID=58180 RepID=UPI000422294F|nr:nucleotidyltransferase [Oleidesulfovibrio alaskensis]